VNSNRWKLPNWLLLGIGLLPFFSLHIVYGKTPVSSTLHRIQVTSPAQLKTFFRYTSHALPLISAHRGGPVAGYPENALETFVHTLHFSHALIECDVHLTKDGHLVLFHDNKLHRSSNGKGLIYEKTLAELKTLRLKDPFGNVTTFSMPTFQKVLSWAKDKTVLFVDVKTKRTNWSIPVLTADEKMRFRKVVQMIQKHKAQSYAVVIVYNAAQARFVAQLDKHLMLSVSLGSRAKLKALLRFLPASRMIAFTGAFRRTLKPKLYAMLRTMGVMAAAGTFIFENNLSKLAMSQKVRRAIQKKLYLHYFQSGIQIMATNHYQAVARAFSSLYKEAKKPTSKYYRYYKKFFRAP